MRGLYIGGILKNKIIMVFRNKELVDKRFVQLKSKVKNLDLMVSRGKSTAQDFRAELKSTYEFIEEFESLIEREASPLRNG